MVGYYDSNRRGLAVVRWGVLWARRSAQNIRTLLVESDPLGRYRVHREMIQLERTVPRDGRVDGCSGSYVGENAEKRYEWQKEPSRKLGELYLWFVFISPRSCFL